MANRKTRPALNLLQFLHPNPAVIHLATVAFEADRAGGREGQGVFQDLAVASAMRDVVRHRDFNFVPILRFVFLQVFVRPGHEVIAALQLRAANEDAAVGIRAGAKFQLEIEVVRKRLRGR